MDVIARPSVKDKDDMYSRWISGEFGNKLRGWVKLEDLEADPYSGTVSVRLTESSSRTARYEVPQYRVSEVMQEMGAMSMQYRFNESAPDDQLIFQGELCDSHLGWCLSYDCDPIKMAPAMQKAKHVFGLTAKTIVRHFLCPNSLLDMQALLDTYPGHVVEFSTYSRTLGDIPNRNTIIWEVRAY